MGFIRARVFASHPIAMREYRRLLSSANGFVLVETEDQSDVSVFDGELQSLDAVLALVLLRTPLARPLLVSSHCDDATCLRWLFRGVWGAVSYDRYGDELCEALRTLAEGRLWFPASVIMQGARAEKHLGLENSTTNLTEREEEILGLLMRRLANKEIASILRITPRTVKFHVGNILRKLQATSRRDLCDHPLDISARVIPGLPVPRPVPQSS